jgi:exodeoxyribonuclease V alpha subunit
METYIKGNYRKSIFKSDKGYVIGLFKLRDTNDNELLEYVNKTITFTGYFHDLNEDDIYTMYGSFMMHPKYGAQYQVTSYERGKPDDEDGLVAFLRSDLFKGIGDKVAQNIVDTLGTDAIDKILKDPSCLYMVPKLTEDKANKLYETLKTYEESHDVIVYLSELGFNMKDSLSIYNTYHNNTLNVVKDNIYDLIYDVKEINFNKVDEIALKLNYDILDNRRIKSLIINIMKELTFINGDTYLNYESINNKVVNYLKDEVSTKDYLDELNNDKKIVIDKDSYYLKELYDAEANIVDKIKILNHHTDLNHKRLDDIISMNEKKYKIMYNDKQRYAIKKSLENNIIIITGGPGTGKTTIIKGIIDVYQELNNLTYDKVVEQVTLLAPTGRASKRMSENTNLKAMTIHRFLKWNKETLEFGVNEKNKDHSKVIIVDEASMIDLMLLDSLFKGILDNTKVILVGDHNQLPSVAPGQILKDLIESDLIETVFLEQLYRQDENSYIVTLANEIKNDSLGSFEETKSDYTFLKCSSESINDNLKNLALQIKDKDYTLSQIQIMAPIYASYNGIDNLNKILQSVFNPIGNEIKVGDVIFRENDKIIQLVNMPDENVFNGDIGFIKKIVKEPKNEIYVDYDSVIVKYDYKDFHKIKHAYIISIHKAQGSEFDLVIMPISKTYKRMLYRKLLYTGITRAKKKLILIGEPDYFTLGVSNNNEYIRNSSLKDKIINAYK